MPVHILKAAHRLSLQGDKYYQAEQWKLATEAYKAALAKLPDDEVLRHNYELAAAHLAAEERRGGRRKAREPLESAESPNTKATAEAAREESERQAKEPEAKPGQDANKLPLHVLKEAHNLCVQGNHYYENKQWKLATEAYKAALEKRPDDEVLLNNYELAAAHLAAEEGRISKASNHLERARLHRKKAAANAKNVKNDGQSSGKPLEVDERYPDENPVIPKDKRTKAIAGLEKKRDEAKRKRIELEQKVSKIQNKSQGTPKETANLGKLKQELSNTKNDENYYNFFIKENLNPPSKSKD